MLSLIKDNLIELLNTIKNVFSEIKFTYKGIKNVITNEPTSLHQFISRNKKCGKEVILNV